MGESKKPLGFMILFSLVRAAILALGTAAASHALISKELLGTLTSDATIQVVTGWLMIAIALGWSVLQKTQVWAWVKAAAAQRYGGAEDALRSAPGPDMPI